MGMQNKMTDEEMDRLIERCRNGEIIAADLHPLLVYEIELRTNERLAQEGQPQIFTFEKYAYNGFAPKAHAVRVQSQDYLELFSELVISLAATLLIFLVFSGGGLFSLKNLQEVWLLLLTSLLTLLLLILLAHKPEDDLQLSDDGIIEAEWEDGK